MASTSRSVFTRSSTSTTIIAGDVTGVITAMAAVIGTLVAIIIVNRLEVLKNDSAVFAAAAHSQRSADFIHKTGAQAPSLAQESAA